MGVWFNCMVKTGEYETSDGEKKNSWQRIGRVMDGQKGPFLLLDALFVSNQLNGLCNKERRDSIAVALFEPKDGGSAPSRSEEKRPVTDDDIPF